jgi:hypothetical protein
LDTILQQLAGPGVPATQGPCITKQQFAAWRKQYTLDALRGARYGVSFCQYFKIPSNQEVFYRAALGNVDIIESLNNSDNSPVIPILSLI